MFFTRSENLRVEVRQEPGCWLWGRGRTAVIGRGYGGGEWGRGLGQSAHKSMTLSMKCDLGCRFPVLRH